MKKNKFLKHLRDHHCYPTGRQRGSHAQFVNDDNGRVSIVPMHDNIKESTAFSICKQLGIPKPGIN